MLRSASETVQDDLWDIIGRKCSTAASACYSTAVVAGSVEDEERATVLGACSLTSKGLETEEEKRNTRRLLEVLHPPLL